MDPVILAAIVSAVTVLATETAKGIGGGAGKDLWSKIRNVLGFDSEPPVTELPATVERRLKEKPELAKQVLSILQSSSSSTVTQLVGQIDAEKVIVAQNISGDIQM